VLTTFQGSKAIILKLGLDIDGFKREASEDGWVAIDPKVVIGEPAYEVAAFIRNPMPALLKHADA